MIARRDFGNDAAVLFMLSDLGRDFAGEQLAMAQDRDRGFIAGSF
jgi:hypothetical protein